MTNSVVSKEQRKRMLMENNMQEKLRYIASKHNLMIASEIKGVSVVDSKLPSDTFNTAFGGQIDEEVAKEVFSYYKKNNQPMAWWIGPNSNTEIARDSLEKAGFIHDELDIGMICNLIEIMDNYQCPPELKIRKCQTKNDYNDFGNVLASVFDPEDEQVKIFYNKMSELSPDSIKDMILFVGYENDYPVATACLFLTKVAGIYDISTRPHKRKLGYGSAMFYRALIEAKKRKYAVGVLQASPDGLNIYKRFGFKETCQFHVWSNKKQIINRIKNNENNN